jgi:hypothetical protein
VRDQSHLQRLAEVLRGAAACTIDDSAHSGALPIRRGARPPNCFESDDSHLRQFATYTDNSPGQAFQVAIKCVPRFHWENAVPWPRALAPPHDTRSELEDPWRLNRATSAKLILNITNNNLKGFFFW